jgi:hypothetical protein
MLGPFLRTPTPDDEKGKKVARAVAWLALIVGFVVVLSVALPP